VIACSCSSRTAKIPQYFFLQAYKEQAGGAYEWVEVAELGCKTSEDFVPEISEQFEVTAQIFRLRVSGTPKSDLPDIRRKVEISELLFMIEGT